MVTSAPPAVKANTPAEDAELIFLSFEEAGYDTGKKYAILGELRRLLRAEIEHQMHTAEKEHARLKDLAAIV